VSFLGDLSFFSGNQLKDGKGGKPRRPSFAKAHIRFLASMNLRAKHYAVGIAGDENSPHPLPGGVRFQLLILGKEVGEEEMTQAISSFDRKPEADSFGQNFLNSSHSR